MLIKIENISDSFEQYIYLPNGFTLKEILKNDDVEYDSISKVSEIKNNIVIHYIKNGETYTYEINNQI